MIHKKKNEKKGLCPFRNLKECSEKCVLYRKGIRYTDDIKVEPFPFVDCALNIIADNLEAMHNRTFMLQKEVGETKNVMAFQVMASLGMVPLEEAERQAEKILMPLIEEMNETKELPEK